MPCWHCQQTHLCDCVFCATESQHGWKPGPCQWCKASKRNEYLQPILEKKSIDPREPRHWRTDKAGTGTFKRIFVPREEFEAVLRQRE